MKTTLHAFMTEVAKIHHACTIDSRGIVVAWSEWASNNFGYHNSEAVGESFYHFCQPDETYDGSFERALAIAYEKGRAELVYHFLGKEDLHFWGKLIIHAVWRNREFFGYDLMVERMRPQENNVL